LDFPLGETPGEIFVVFVFALLPGMLCCWQAGGDREGRKKNSAINLMRSSRLLHSPFHCPVIHNIIREETILRDPSKEILPYSNTICYPNPIPLYYQVKEWKNTRMVESGAYPKRILNSAHETPEK